VTRDPLLGLLIQERPKTDAGRRTIALPPQTLDLIRRRLARLPAAADPPMIFPSASGLLRDPNNASGDLRKALGRAGFLWATSHTSLRRRGVAVSQHASPRPFPAWACRRLRAQPGDGPSGHG
jgi:integrase